MQIKVATGWLGLVAITGLCAGSAMASSMLTPLGGCIVGETCQIMTHAQCVSLDGTYLGDGTHCDVWPVLQEPGNRGGLATVGDPVYLFSGELYQSVEDLRIRGRGTDFTWGRKYRSRIGGISAIGNGWDYSYDIRLTLNEQRPGEVTDLQFAPDKQTLFFTPPLDPGGAVNTLRFCTRRSTDPANFASAATTTLTDVDQKATQTSDAAVPAPGQLYSYLVSAKNLHGEGSSGTVSGGTPRVVLPCGGPTLVLMDGTGRQDVFAPQPGGMWQASELFQVLTQNPGGSFTLQFPDLSAWTFHAFDGSPAQGRIETLADANGNALQFFYDGLGRLTTILDTLSRSISVSWNGLGLIGTVTDFAGRQIRYEYYNGVEPGGSYGDLKSVTTPAVTGTPTGNDFPLGKTIVYTYSSGYPDDRLNHNLLTATDAKGQTYLVNEYASTLNPADVDFDHVRRQTWGDPGDVIDFVYRSTVPTPANGSAVVQVVVNDRVGNVSAYFFDIHNRCTVIRDYTGRADPDQPTDLDGGINLPVGPLRASDPQYFETRYEWNDDALPLRIVHPDQNEELRTYDSANVSRRSHGNLLQRCRLPGPLGGDQLQICESMNYDPAINHGSNLPTRVVDPRGAQTLHAFDVHGNLTRTVRRIPTIIEDFEYNTFGQLTAHVLPENGSGNRRRDEFHYYAAGPQNGYLQQEIVDASNLALTTSFEYDATGNVVREVDPRGHDSLFVYDQRDQLVRETSREVTDGGGLRYREDKYYDANDNVIREDIRNYDDQGVLQPNAAFSQLDEYDVLDEVTRSCGEVGDATLSPAVLSCSAIPLVDLPQFAVREYGYDANRQRTLERYGEAFNGHQPTNTVRTLYDERGLTFQRIRAQGDPAQSTRQEDFDGDMGRRRLAEGLEASPRVTLDQRDGFGRLVRETDPMGNVAIYHYDANGNLISSRREGELADVPGSAANVRLAEAAYVWDDMDRLVRIETQYFDPVTQAPLPGGQQSGKVITAVEHAGDSQIVRTIDDHLHQLLTTYDTANREKTATDPLGNRVTYVYDANSNVTQVSELEKSDLGSPDATYTTNYAYDNLDRLRQRTDAIGNTLTYGYDSRGHRTRFVDALNREQRQAFDGLGRHTRTVQDMNGNGADPGDSQDIVTLEGWDASGRLVSRTDDNGSATTYQYDALDRLAAIHSPDGTQETFSHDAKDDETSRNDANGSAMSQTYDLNGRLSTRNIIPGFGVSSDTTFELYGYDGKSRLVRAEDNDAVLTYTYDSLSNARSETVLGQTTAVEYDGVGNRMRTVYPGGRALVATYDALERMKTLADTGGNLATYSYRGPTRVERRDHRNGTRTAYAYDGVLPNPPGDFGRRRVVGTTHTRIAGGTILDARTYRWDRNQSKTRRADTRVGGPRLTHDYGYDAANRLVQTLVTNAVPVTVRSTGYTLDGTQNRLSVTGTPDPGPYVRGPADAVMNQYTSTPFDARQYDDNGNLTAITPNGGPTTSVVYDYRNRMVDYFDGGTGQHHEYRYDALGRRIAKVIDVGGAPVETRYFRDGRHVVEERDGAGVTVATYAWGRSIDEILQMERGGVQYFYAGDDLSNVMALTNLAGNVVERYDYLDFGVPEFRDASGNTVLPVSSSPVGNPFLLHGRRYDTETGWYCHRNRFRDPRSGEWTTRDVLGPWGDSSNLGDANGFVGNNPWTYTDPFGKKKTEKPETPEQALKRIKKAIEAAETAKKAAQDEKDAAQDNLDNKNKGSNEAKARLEKAKTALDKATSALDTLNDELKKAVEAVEAEKPKKAKEGAEKESTDLDDLLGEGNFLDEAGNTEPATKEGIEARKKYKEWKEARDKEGQSELTKDDVEQLEKWKKAMAEATKHLRDNDDHKNQRSVTTEARRKAKEAKKEAEKPTKGATGPITPGPKTPK